MMSFWSFSQELKPTVYTTVSDTLFCFTTGQARTLAMEIEKGGYCDSISAEYQKKAILQDSLISVQDTAIYLMKSQILNLNTVLENKDSQAEGLILQIEENFMEINKHKRDKAFLKTGLGISIGVIGIIVILN